MRPVRIDVDSEIGDLECLLIHRPDKGIGRITPEKLEDWLYDDTVYLARMQEEYDAYLKVLLWFLDEERARATIGKDSGAVMRPDSPEFVDSPHVLDVQKELADMLEADPAARGRLVAVICALEGAHHDVQRKLDALPPTDLARVLITGFLPDPESNDPERDGAYLFPPVPNLVFTRDIGIVVRDHLLLSKTLYEARRRESELAKFIAFNHFFRDDHDRVLEISEPSDFFLLDEHAQAKRVVTIEGGDVMMIAPGHLIVGCSERTSPQAGLDIVHQLFGRDLGIEMVSIVKIPPNRAQMHIDTIFTMVARDTWVLFGAFSEELRAAEAGRRHDYTMLTDDRSMEEPSAPVYQFYRWKHGRVDYDPTKDYGMSWTDYENHAIPEPKGGGLDGLMHQISVRDFGCDPDSVRIIYSGNNEFPYDEREQWTDACNYLALREGVVIGYDRNERTAEAFRNAGYDVVGARELIAAFEAGERKPSEVERTLIELPSAELSRARGGSHCMSMPLRRAKWNGQ